MDAGTVIGGRFEVGPRIGAGGMGAVYRALDHQTDEPVAIKVMNKPEGATLERFFQEARLLAELSHPGIVRHLAHGATDEGHPYLAMEWLQGEDLQQRLERRALSIEQALAVVRKAADALGAAHRTGVIHRDIKPGNLFLVGHNVDRVKVLDFGVARGGGAPQTVTKSGAIVGTVGYMAPEQAQNAKNVDARADLFALGCVLYECITGKPAFAGYHAVAILAKLLVEEPPRAREVRADLPPELDALVARMMAKDRADRPTDAETLLADIDALGRMKGAAPEAATGRNAGMSGEQRVVTAILVQSARVEEKETWTPVAIEHRQRAVQERVHRYGGQAAALGNGVTVVVFHGHGAATDQACQAASCALALREALPEARIALATGRAQTGGRTPVGPAIDAAASMIERHDPGTVRIDEVTSGLLDPRYEVAEGELRRESQAPEGARRLLGKPTPLVGRRKELRLLRDTLEESIEERAPQALLVTAPAGVGKSRLRHAFVEETTRRRPAPLVLTARAQAVGAGSEMVLARQLVRSGVGLGPEAGVDAHPAIRTYVDGLSVDAPERVADFLGELAGVPNPATGTPQLKAARDEPRIMNEWLERSFVEWMAAETARQPVLVILEDLHWGDRATLAMLERTFQDHGRRPLMVLALARPEVRDAMPNLFADVGIQELSLQGLNRRATEELIRAVLGDQVEDDLVERIAVRSQGNAFYLEELIRHAAQGAEELPETVLAMVEARLAPLEPEARQVLRAASLFGETCWQGGVEAGLGNEATSLDVRGWLDALVDRELLERSPTSRYAGQPEYAFRHALVRESVYATLTDDDARAGHARVGEWLEGMDEPNPHVLIAHFEAGKLHARIAPHCLRAAQGALDAGNLEDAAALAQRGLDAGATETLRGQLLVRSALAYGYLQQWELVVDTHQQALDLVRPGCEEHIIALSGLTVASARLGRPELGATVVHHLLTMEERIPATGPAAFGLNAVTIGSLHIGELELTDQALTWIDELIERSECDPAVMTWALIAHGANDHWRRDDPAGTLSAMSRAWAEAERAGDVLAEALSAAWWYLISSEVGRFESCSFVDDPRVRRGGRTAVEFARAAAFRRDFQKGHAEAARAHAEALCASTDPSVAALGYAGLAECDLKEGRTTEAETRVTGALEHAWSTLEHTAVLAIGGGVALAANQPELALERSDHGWRLSQSAATAPYDSSQLLLHRAEALLRLERYEEAREGIGFAYDRMRRIQASLPDDYGQAYVDNLPFNRRIRELAREHL